MVELMLTAIHRMPVACSRKQPIKTHFIAALFLWVECITKFILEKFVLVFFQSMFIDIIKVLVAVFITCLILAASQRKEVQEGFESACSVERGGVQADATVDTMQEEGLLPCECSARVTDDSASAASDCSLQVTDDCKTQRYDLPTVKTYACLATYADTSTAPVFLEDTWASPETASHVGTMLPTFHFDEHQGFS